MFTFVGDTVLDPFLGSGTTVKVAIDLGRQGVGYEINESFVSLIEEKLGVKNKLPIFSDNIEIINRDIRVINLLTIDYNPIIQDANPIIQYREEDYKKDNLSKVIEIVNKDTIRIDNGNLIKFLGINVNRSQETIAYLNKQLLGKKVILKDQTEFKNDNNITLAYIYLKNKIFINAYLIKSGLANADISINHRFANKFIKLWRECENA